MGQSIAAVGNGFNGGAVRTQGSDGFPDGGPADAELVGKYLPGDIPPARCVQRCLLYTSRLYTEGEGCPSLICVEQDYTGKAKEIALAYACLLYTSYSA